MKGELSQNNRNCYQWHRCEEFIWPCLSAMYVWIAYGGILRISVPAVRVRNILHAISPDRAVLPSDIHGCVWPLEQGCSKFRAS